MKKKQKLLANFNQLNLDFVEEISTKKQWVFCVFMFHIF